MADHFQGGRLLGEEKDLLSLVDGACDEVDDGLRLSRPGRSLDHQARSFGNVENGRVLGAVHGQGEGGHRFRVLLVVDVPQGEPLLDGVAAEYPGTHSGNAFIGETFRKQFRWGDAGRPEDADRHPPAEVPLGPSVLGRVVLEQVEVGVYVEVFRILFHGFWKPGRFFPRGLLEGVEQIFVKPQVGPHVVDFSGGGTNGEIQGQEQKRGIENIEILHVRLLPRPL